MRFGFSLLGLLLLPFLLFSQQASSGSLLEALSSTQGKPRVDLLNQIIDKLRITDQDQALDYAKESQKLAQKLDYPEGIITSSYYLSILERDQKNYRRAINAAEEGLEWSSKEGTTQDLMKGYKILETIYRISNRKSRAEEYAEYYRDLKDSLDMIELKKQSELLSGKIEQEQNINKSVVEENEALNEALQEAEMNEVRKEMDIARLEMEAAQFEALALQNEIELGRSKIQQEKDRNLKNLAISGAIFLLLLSIGGSLWFRSHRMQRLAQLEQERLQKIDQIKDQFLANTSHELRTPLNGIIGLAESLFDHADNKLQEENLSMIISSGRRLSSLVDDILDFSRLKNHQIHLQLKPLDPHALVESVLNLNSPLADKKNIRLENRIPRDMPAMMADENRMQQILHNLIGNAIKFTEQGWISISAHLEDSKPENSSKPEDQRQMVVFAVSDTGIGIPKEKLGDIFKEFQQADGSISREHSGTGLGLSISTQLINLHGGKLWVESEEGKGSTFFMSIPSTQKAAQTLSASPKLSSRPLALVNGKNKGEIVIKEGSGLFNILIVDDEPINQQVFQSHLIGQPFSITSAMNGEEAIAMIRAGKKFDMVLLDIMMPRMSGYEVCSLIREEYMPSELPVIMVTAKNQVQDLVQGLSTGANDYLAKPFSKDELLARVKTHLNLHTINTATSRFVPYEFIRALGRETITEVQLGDQVEKEVSVFFSDIRSYTSLSEEMSPEDNFGFVSAYAKRMGPIINEHKGFVNQFLGDGIMAIFQDDPADSINAAIAMQMELQQYNEIRSKKSRKPLRVGMGIHTGPLIMGIIGDDTRSDAATISDTVNTASRMEGLTKFYGARILVSESTLASLEDPTSFSFRYLGQVQVKGKKQAIGVYEFFDDTSDPVQQLKWQHQKLFEQALRHYYAKEFEQALGHLGKIIVQNPDDSAAIHYRARTKACIDFGINDDWTGVELMEMK